MNPYNRTPRGLERVAQQRPVYRRKPFPGRGPRKQVLPPGLMGKLQRRSEMEDRYRGSL